MKKEVILLYLTCEKIYVYLMRAKREVIICKDTSSFFKLGEISDVELCKKTLDKIITEEKILTGLFRPNLYVLYNDITNCDLMYLYNAALVCFNYEKISFIPLSDIIKMINIDSRVVLFDKNYYTIFKEKTKTRSADNINFKPIYIGKKQTNATHYSDDAIVWKTFISYFTKN